MVAGPNGAAFLLDRCVPTGESSTLARAVLPADHEPVDEASDAELVLAARTGDIAGLALLLERYRPAMRASAIRVLGWRAEVEDAVQDAMLSALRRLDDLRDPAAAGPWLQTIARNAARMRLRATTTMPYLESDQNRRSARPTPEEVVEAHALRDWLWTGIGELSEPLQQVVLLRYFSSITAYTQIAAASGIPLGTVRSRLNQARRQLASGLLRASDGVHRDSSRAHRSAERSAREFLASVADHDFRQRLVELTAPRVRIIGPQGQREVGPGFLAAIMESDQRAGVRERVQSVIAGSRITIWECDLLSPPSDPTRCPPAVLWMITSHAGRMAEIRLYHPAA
jgi:RNA polymerase sigma-70 factor (ECF subfamily)